MIGDVSQEDKDEAERLFWLKSGLPLPPKFSVASALPEPQHAPEVPDTYEPPAVPARPERSAEERGKSGPSQSTELVQLARSRYEVVRGIDSKTYAVAHNQPGIAFPLKGSKGLKAALASEFYDNTGRTATGSALSDALQVIEGDAATAPERRIDIRVGSFGQKVVIDLGTPDARVVEVGADAWRILDRSPVMFRRNVATLAMPDPVIGGSLDGLRALLNVRTDRFRLIVGWILAAFMPDIPHPILTLTGEQGTAKTTAASLVLSLVDPSPSPMQSQPSGQENWGVMAFNIYGIGLDNVSKLQPWFQDALCKAVTGDALMGRERYSDDAISILTFRRPIAMTTIDPGAIQGDVADRMLLLELDPIAATARRTDKEVKAAGDAIRGESFGALLDLLVRVLRELPNVHLTEKPRMADFAEILAALDAVTGWTTLADYLDTTKNAAHDAVDGNEFVSSLATFILQRGTWNGTCGELLAELTGDTKPAREWPKNPHTVAAQLKRYAPALLTYGITVTKVMPKSNRGQIYALDSAAAVTGCAVCGQELSEALMKAGQTTHPTCDTENLDEEPF